MTCTQEQFLKDVGAHAMTVVRDSGTDRHIKFRNTDGGSPYWFEILTWPGALCIRGDMGTYVFSRLADMFEFFRTDDRGDPAKLYINRGYWCEKLQAVDSDGYGRGRADEFSYEKFEKRVKERVESHLEDAEISDERRTELMAEIQEEILSPVLDHRDEGDAFRRMSDFHARDFPDLFADCWEWNCKEYTFHFVWNLYAIAWAIRQYDAAKKATADSLENQNA
ncbi:hypothetical protein PAN31117_03145 [Pandoraea anapnoica]|uniref:Uncharacterized protein n=2 Tax=Pandoraea anapnoica TaxID=2508301 RepID=A0A5E5A5H8_9BURK|nr:hypothetical protein PAN31117_03145 [Pandoraea anapnoica]